MGHPPPINYVRSAAGDLAYQVFGDGATDLVIVPSWVGNIEFLWDLPETVRFFEKLAAFSRLVIFDKRGTGLSDRAGGVATLEERADDVAKIMDAAGSERAAVAGWRTRLVSPRRSPQHTPSESWPSSWGRSHRSGATPTTLTWASRPRSSRP